MLLCLLDLWAGLRAAHHLYWTLHWQSKGQPFYGDHLMFERLYGQLPEEIDGLAEIIAGHYGSDKLDPIKAWSMAQEKINAVAKQPSPLAIAEMVLQLAEHAAAEAENGDCPYPGGLQNFLQGISTTHLTDVYLLKQRYKGA